jgi:excisionase family DNA binding protein
MGCDLRKRWSRPFVCPPVRADATGDVAGAPDSGGASTGVHRRAGAAHLDQLAPNENDDSIDSLAPIRDREGLRASDRLALTPTEVSRLLGVDRRTISRAVEDGDLHGVRIGRKLFISRVASSRSATAQHDIVANRVGRVNWVRRATVVQRRSA